MTKNEKLADKIAAEVLSQRSTFMCGGWDTAEEPEPEKLDEQALAWAIKCAVLESLRRRYK